MRPRLRAEVAALRKELKELRDSVDGHAEQAAVDTLKTDVSRAHAAAIDAGTDAVRAHGEVQALRSELEHARTEMADAVANAAAAIRGEFVSAARDEISKAAKEQLAAREAPPPAVPPAAAPAAPAKRNGKTTAPAAPPQADQGEAANT